MATTISMDILARDRASRTLDTIGDRADRSARRWAAMGRIARNAGVAVGVGVTAAAAASVKLVKGAMEDQQAAVQLATAYRNNAGARDSDIAASERWISTQGRLLGVTDDELRPALAQMVTATHDVAKAQDQVSLAMNVAAGRKVSLATVTKALEKAQNGSLGGLSRLGARTKDAAGNTLTLDQITRQLAQTYRGQAAAAADTAEGKFGRVRLVFTETGEAIGYKLLPFAERLSDWALGPGMAGAESLWAAWEDNGIDGVVRRLEDLTDTQGDLKPIVDDVRKALGSTADIITGSLVPAVGDIARALPPFVQPLGLVADTLGFVADHSDLARYAIVGLTGVLAVNRAQMLLSKVAGSDLVTSLTAQASAAERAASRQRLLRSALRNAAGMGGMLALSASADETDAALAGLERTAGGLAVGFAVGGPLGAAIGGTAGLLSTAYEAGKKSRQENDRQREALDQLRQGTLDYKDSLDQATGAVSKLTSEQIINEARNNGVLAATHALGVNARDLVGAVLGQEGATRRLNRALADNHGELAGMSSVDYRAWVRHNTAALADQRDEVRENAAATRGWKSALKGLPPEVRTKVKNIGTDITMGQLRRLRRQYDLSPKQVQTIIKAIGTEAVVKRVKGVWTVMQDGKKVRPGTDKWADLFIADLNRAQQGGRRGTTDLTRMLSQGTKSAKADLEPWKRSIRQAASTSVEQGRTGAKAVGAAMKAGVLAGFAGTQSELEAEARAAVRAAIQGARQEAQVRSPSRKTYYIGQMMGRGTANGMRSERDRLSTSGAQMMADIVRGIRRGQIPMDRVLDAVTNKVRSTADRVKELKSARSAIVSDFRGFSTSLFAAEAPEEGPITVASLMAQQTQQRDQAAAVKAAVGRLTGLGLSGDLLKQMQAGGAGGIPALLALAKADRTQVQRFNDLNAQTQSYYGSAGMNVADVLQRDEERQAARDQRAAKEIARAVRDAIENREAKYEFILRGNTLVAIQKKTRRDKGKKD